MKEMISDRTEGEQYGTGNKNRGSGNYCGR